MKSTNIAMSLASTRIGQDEVYCKVSNCVSIEEQDSSEKKWNRVELLPKSPMMGTQVTADRVSTVWWG